ncbi:MBL fold metallo-hydrolase, partial [Mogibacterium sp.]
MSINIKLIECAPIGENTYVVKDDATGLCAVIDPGCHSDLIDDFIGGENKLVYIILTHAHWD